MLKKILFSFIATIFSLAASAQNYNPAIDSLINIYSLDSLVSYVRILSGEDSVMVDTTKVLIKQRIYSSNDTAALYIEQTLESFGLEPVMQDFGMNGTNVYAIKEGTLYPDEYYMICAHYDGVADHTADDNASGTATVLESARVLSNIDFAYSIIYALWDEEEIGLIGSDHFASQAFSDGMIIHGVINIDMIGWDGNDDGLVEIHLKNVAESVKIAAVMDSVNSIYDIGLDVSIENPGTSASDHSSFWNNGYSALLLIEGYYSGDFNPFYHSDEDRISEFNLPYFHSAAQLAFGTVTTMADPKHYVGVQDFATLVNTFEISCYPNPTKYKATIEYTLVDESVMNIFLVNNLGQQYTLVSNQPKQEGTYNYEFYTSDLPEGIYTVLVNNGKSQSGRKLVVIK